MVRRRAPAAGEGAPVGGGRVPAQVFPPWRGAMGLVVAPVPASRLVDQRLVDAVDDTR
jgi:hypothetical protein